jgi:hypothetical protein
MVPIEEGRVPPMLFTAIFRTSRKKRDEMLSGIVPRRALPPKFNLTT